MRFINRKVHAMLDYISGLLLLASPWLFGFYDVADARWVALILGCMMLILALNTDYEGGVTKLVTMSTHLNVDIVTGLLLASSPWVLGFADQVFLPHLILGVMEIGAGLFTERKSEHPRSSHIDEIKHAQGY